MSEHEAWCVEGETLLAVGQEPARAAALLTRAAEHGHARAAERCAVLAACGVGRAPDWKLAAAYLGRAAEAGSAHAKEQWSLLSMPDDPLAAAAASWGDPAVLERWLQPPPRVPICEAPRIRSVAAFIPSAWCRWLIAAAEPRLCRARVYDERTGAGILDPGRTGREAEFGILEADLILLLVRARIAAAAGVPTAVLEPTRILNYAPGQHFAPHFDFIDPQGVGMSAEIERKGQRIATFLVYLNDDYDGGETEFVRAGVRYRGRVGDGLLFANTRRSGEVDPASLHTGLPPDRGQKWVLSQWMRSRGAA